MAPDGAAPTTQELFDPVLKLNQKESRQLVRELHARGLVTLLGRAEEWVGLFAVCKVKGESQRLIVDARKSKSRFRSPPGVSLVSTESSRVSRWSCRRTPYAMHRDIRHQRLLSSHENPIVAVALLRTPTGFGVDSGLEGKEVFGHLLSPESSVSVGWAMFPMDFTWSLCFAQVSNARRAASALGVPVAHGLHDRGPPMVIRSWLVPTYEVGDVHHGRAAHECAPGRGWAPPSPEGCGVECRDHAGSPDVLWAS